MYKHCQECFDKKHDACAAKNVEEVDSSDANDDNAAISTEIIITFSNEQRSFEGLYAPTLFYCGKGNIVISEKRCGMLQKNVMK